MSAPHETFAQSTLGAGGLLIVDGYVLLVQLNYGRFKGHWILPGGMVNQGEFLHQACQREFQEETGMDVRVGAMLSARHRVQDNPHCNLYVVFLVESELDQPLNAKLVWPSSELMQAKFWPVEQAVKDPMVRPATQEYIAAGQGAVSGLQANKNLTNQTDFAWVLS
ncbi:MAG: hypothetical protein CL675_02810 [Bdellovibrionaceae bacterium]|mgnify:CR=1 FL=1|nr:hypothetical protein [Pseudobdellovibrionaceae bacterium]|tara:strand:+ start:163 stop:660 length:498 start_codon:yes stop_codon:yes gene_type:complete